MRKDFTSSFLRFYYDIKNVQVYMNLIIREYIFTGQKLLTNDQKLLLVLIFSWYYVTKINKNFVGNLLLKAITDISLTTCS